MPSLRITNLSEFEAKLSAGVKNLSKNVFDSLAIDAEKLFKEIPSEVEQSAEFSELKNNDELRGQLGLASSSYKSGNDTDAPDLIDILRRYKVKKSGGLLGGTRRLSIIFPTLSEFESILVHNLSKIRNGKLRKGPTVSWFRWWEFGFEGTTTTIGMGNIQAALQKSTTGRARSKALLLDTILNSSRSGFALQVEGTPTPISGRNLIARTYEKYLTIFPRRMQQVLNNIVRKNGGRADKFFARGVIR